MPAAQTAPNAPAAEDLLGKAGRLADSGRLEEAVALCDEIMREKGACAAGCCLMGLIHEASGDDVRAEDCFSRALYLDQDHYESLVHLALLLEQRGDAGRASLFRKRAERVHATQNRQAKRVAL